MLYDPVGQELECVDNLDEEDNLSIGTKYKVLSIQNILVENINVEEYVVKDNFNIETGFTSSRFKRRLIWDMQKE